MEYGKAIINALDSVLADLPTDTGILFSGGVDSSLLATISKRHSSPVLYTVGIEGAPDLLAAEKAATKLELPWKPIVIDGDELESHCMTLLKLISAENPVTVSFELPLQVVASVSREKVIITGQGADELFAGFHKYLSMSLIELKRSLKSDLAKVIEQVMPLDHRIANHHGKEIIHPFLDHRMIDVANSIPVEDMIIGGVRKVPLRHAAELMDLGSIASREKKAAQYGSGIMKVLRERSRDRSLTIREYFKELSLSNETIV